VRPDGPVAQARDYSVRPCPFVEGAAFIRAHHYAKGCANTAVYMHGLYRGDRLVGVAQWLPPTKVCAQSVNRENWRRVLALSRLAVHPDEPQNCASMLIGRSVRLIRADRKWLALVTFADESQGHTGAIYRATNWHYVGRTGAETRWVDSTGKQVARKATHSRTVAQMTALGYARAGRHHKHKFVMRLAS
jgi:hypothetical protein